MQALVAALTVCNIGLVYNIERSYEEFGGTCGGQLLVLLGECLTHLEQLGCLGILTYEQVPEMGAEPANKLLRIETLGEQLIENPEAVGVIALQEIVGKPEIVMVIENIQVFNYLLVGNVATAEAHHLVEN